MGGPKPRTVLKAHDFRTQMWGHSARLSVTNDGGKTGKMNGFGSGIAPGDYLILPNDQSFASYRVDTIKYTSDPPDMWFATVTHDPGVFGVTVDSNEIIRMPKEK